MSRSYGRKEILLVEALLGVWTLRAEIISTGGAMSGGRGWPMKKDLGELVRSKGSIWSTGATGGEGYSEAKGASKGGCVSVGVVGSVDGK
jgi:hypothetical protein